MKMVVKIQYPDRNTKSPIVTVGTLKLYFSYETIVAFDSPIMGFWISKNVWGKTTGRHLNEINPDKKLRVGTLAFQEVLASTLKVHSLD